MVNLQNKDVAYGNPVEIERATNSIRMGLASAFPWLSHPYHIAHRFYEKKENKELYYPETYIGLKNGKYRYHPLTPDNDYSGMCFFIVGDEMDGDNKGFLKYDVSIVFSCNLKLIDNEKLKEYLFTQELIADVRKWLKSNEYTFDFSFSVNSITRDLRSVYREFLLDKIEQYNRAPLQCFRVNLEIVIAEDC